MAGLGRERENGFWLSVEMNYGACNLIINYFEF